MNDLDGYGNSPRVCGGCSAWILIMEANLPTVFCQKCQAKQPSFKDWAASVKPDDLVYVQPYEAWRGMTHSRYLVTARSGDMLTVQLLGIPESSRQVHIGNCAPQDVTPWRNKAMY